MDILQPAKVADVQAQSSLPRARYISPGQFVNLFGVHISRRPSFAGAFVYVLDVVEDEMVLLCNCRCYKMRQRDDYVRTVVALVPSGLIRMLERVHVVVVLDDEMSPRADVLLGLVVGNMDNLAAGVLEFLEHRHARVAVPVHLEPLLVPNGNSSDELNVGMRRGGNIGKHLERKE